MPFRHPLGWHYPRAVSLERGEADGRSEWTCGVFELADEERVSV